MGSVESSGISDGSITKKKKKKITTEFLLNYLHKSGSHAHVGLQQVGTGYGSARCIIGRYGKYRGWIPWGHSEGTTVTKQLKPMEWQRDKEKQRPFPLECSNSALWPLVHSPTKDCALANTKGEQAGSCLRLSPVGGREACVQQPELEHKGLHCNLRPRDCISHLAVNRLPVTNHVFLGSWMVHICQEFHSLRLASRGDSWSTWDCTLMVHLWAWVAWNWEMQETHDPPGTVSSQCTWKP